MTINEQLHHSAAHKPGSDPACPVCLNEQYELQRQEMKTQLEAMVGLDNLYSVMDLLAQICDRKAADAEEDEAACTGDPDDWRHNATVLREAMEQIQ